MRVSVLQDQLAKGLNIVSRTVDNRPTLPVLANVLLAAEDARLTLAATNLELTIVTHIGARVDDGGAITLPAKTFAELVNNLSTADRVNLTLDNNTQTVKIASGMTHSNIRGIASGEFPPIPVMLEPEILVSGKVLRSMISETVFAAAKEDSRPVLTGLYVEFDGSRITMAAADGYRLAVRTAEVDNGFTGKRSFVIPAKTLSEVAKIITDDDKEVGIALPGERDLIQFAYESTVISSQLLEGKFPDFGAIIPKSYSTVLTVYTSDLLKQCKRAEIFARDSNFSARIQVKPAANAAEPGEVLIVGKSAERGDNEGMLDATVEGEALEVAFNIRYLIDALSVISDEQVTLESKGSGAPGVLRPRDRSDYIYVVMPMAINR